MNKRMIAMLASVVLLCGLLPVGASAVAGQTIVPENAGEKMIVHGRTIFNTQGGLRLFWTNSGFTVKFEGTSLTASLAADVVAAGNYAYLNVYIDGALVPSATVKLDSSSKSYALAADLPFGEHTVEVRKRNEAAYSDSSSVTVKSVTTDGTFLAAPAAPSRVIEFVGDSITSGFGNLVTDGSGDYTSDTVEGTLTWAVLAAKMLGAEANVLSRSGIGYCRNVVMHGRPDNSFYDYYTQTAALPEGTVSSAAWDFENHPSDVIVINLGSNDSGGTYNGGAVPDAVMTSEAVAFLELVREKNPHATIIWHYGLMGSPRRAALEEAVAIRREDGDEKVHFLLQRQFNATTEGTGTHGHPSVQADINRSEDLVRFIAQVMGWEWDAAPMLAAQRYWSEQYNTVDQLSLQTPGSAQAFGAAVLAADALLAADAVENETMITAANDLWQAYANRRLLADMSKDYIVVDACDETRGVALGGSGKKGFDYTDRMEGSACLSTKGTGSVYINHVGSYNIPLPEEAEKWFFECWLYIDHPDRIPGEACLEVSQEVDVCEISWGLNSLGLQAGWNKLQLPMRALPAGMTTLKNIRLFLIGVTEPVTLKLDYVVLSKGRVAEDTTALSEAAVAAEDYLLTATHNELLAALQYAKAAMSQADVDAAAARLLSALEDAQNHKHSYDNACDADCNGCGEKREPPHRWENERDDFCEGCGTTRDVTALGDVNGDGKVDSTDARMTLQYAVKKITDEQLNLAAADVNGSGQVDSTDARLILQRAVEKIDKFPAE